MKKSVRFIFVLGAAALLNACTSIPTVEDTVVSRSGGLKETPEWANPEYTGYSCIISKDGTVKKGVSSSGERYFCSLGMYNEPAKKGTKIRLGFESAENDARKNIVSAIKTKLAFAMEEATDGENGENNTVARTLNVLSDGILRGSKPGKRYWEKKIVRTEDGQSFQIDYFALVHISESDLRNSIDAAAKKTNLDARTKEMLNKGAEIVYSRDE